MAAEVCDKSPAVDEAMRYVPYLYQEHSNSELTNNTLYIKHTNCEKWVIYERQGALLARVVESLPDHVEAALGNMKPEPSTRAVVEFHERTQGDKQELFWNAAFIFYEEEGRCF